MICSNCGKEVNELSKFCTFCGTPTAAPQTETAPAQLKKKKKKKGKAGLIIVLVLLLLVVGGGCAFIFMQMNQPVNRIETALSSGDLDAAIALFDEIENDEDLEAVTGQALTYAESVKNDYLNEVEGMDYANAYAILTKLSSGILAENAEVTEMIALVDRINISRAAFSSAGSGCFNRNH